MSSTDSLVSRVRGWPKDPRQIPVSELNGIERGIAVAARNWYWGRTSGWANLLEEHDLNPLVRVPRDLSKLVWRVTEGVEPGQAQPVLLFGAQRSGTNMVTHGLARAPEVEVHNEGNRRAFHNYRLREADVLTDIVRRSRHQLVLFKPLLDSHNAVELLEDVKWNRPARALWVYREMRARVRSAVAKFGDSNLRVLRKRVEEPGFRHWQLGDSAGLSPVSQDILDSFDPSTLSANDGAALFWLIRNRLFFELSLEERDDVCLISYDRFLEMPESTMRRVCDFLEFPFRDSLVDHIESRPAPLGVTTDIASPILELCEGLMNRLEGAEAQAISSAGS